VVVLVVQVLEVVGACEFCGGGRARVVELVEGHYAPEEFRVCGGCMLWALMRFAEAVELGHVEPATP
jgi:hypothetical protein